MKTLSTWRSTHVNNVIALLRICNLRNQHGTYILHDDFTLDKSIQCKNMVKFRNAVCIRQIWSRRYMNALTFQAFYNLFLGIQISPASDGKRMFHKKIRQYLLCCFFSIGFQPPGYQHLWHGILYRKIFQQIIFFLREPDLIHFPGYGTKNTIYKRLQIIKTFSLRQLHSLIAHCAVWHTIHVFQLIYCTS